MVVNPEIFHFFTTVFRLLALFGTSIQYTESIWTMITPYKTTKLFGIYRPMIKTISGWWFQTWLLFSISYMRCHPSHWLIFFKMVKTTNQIEIWLWKFLWPSQRIGFFSLERLSGGGPKKRNPEAPIGAEAMFFGGWLMNKYMDENGRKILQFF